MSAIRSRGNAKTEKALVTILRRNKLVGWRRHPPLPGNPDFVFPSARLVVFVDGCFWHGCPRHGRKPDSNLSYWLPKLSRNKNRDRKHTITLRRSGWTVLRLWEHELRFEKKVLARCRKALEEAQRRYEKRRIKLLAASPSANRYRIGQQRVASRTPPPHSARERHV